MKNITLKEMFDILVDCIMNRKDIPALYYKTEYEEGKPEFLQIEEVDLMRGRFITINNDFSEYEWEKEKSNIYILK
jgi:hypothetical protein